MLDSLLRKIVNFLDPKLDKYRTAPTTARATFSGHTQAATPVTTFPNAQTTFSGHTEAAAEDKRGAPVKTGCADAVPKKWFGRSGERCADAVPKKTARAFVSAPHAPRPVFTAEKEQAPQTVAEFVAIIQHTPRSVLSTRDRRRIAAVMSFDQRQVRDLMVPKKQMLFVRDTEILGPLMLDKLYQSGFNNFPVVDRQHHVLGILNTEALNTLEIRETDRADKYLDTLVHYLHASDSLSFAISEIEHTNNYYFLVLDELETLAGCFTVQQLLDYLLG